jgi:elongation factor G
MLENVRNIGIIAHVDAGKTTTTERILYYSGTKHKVGDVDTGDTTTDFDPLERQKGITINSAAVSIDWGDHTINIIDTPGHVDFTAEVERSLRVLDGGVCVFCAVGGVEVQSETVWFQANKYKVPRIAYINKLDRLGADFFDCVEQIKTKLKTEPAICTIPVGQSSEFKGIIDLIRMKFVRKDPNDSKHEKYDLVDIPESHRDQAAHYRELLLETASHGCDELLEQILEGKPISEEMLLKALRQGTLAGKFNPVHCGTSKMFHGVRELLDMVVDFFPSPVDRPPVEGIVPKTKENALRKPDPKEPFAALAFKTVAESTGDLVYLRIYSGLLSPGDTVLNTTNGRTERIGRLYRMMGATRQELETAGPGDIVAVIGLKQTYTGNTVCAESAPIALESIVFPKPVISASLTTARSVDTSKLADALGRLVRDDPTIKAHTDEETKDLILSGMGELHLEVSLEKLKRAINLPQGDPALSLSRPRVAYRQTFARPLEYETRYIKQSGGRGKFAVIHMRYEPLSQERLEEVVAKVTEDGEKPDPNNIYFADEIVGGVVPKEYIPSVEAGYRQGAAKGTKYPFPFVDLMATLYDGKYHDVDSSQDAFKAAGWESFREAQVKAGIVLLEPIMNVVVISPEAHQGPIAGDINRRRGMIMEMVNDKGRSLIKAQVPLANLFGYTTDLRGATSGTASFSMEFSHYAPVKEELADLPEPQKK